MRLVLVLLIATPLAGAAPAAAPASADWVGPGEVVWAGDHGVVLLESEAVPGTEGDHVRPHRLRWSVQRDTSAERRLALEMTGVFRPGVVTVLPDGTLGVTTGDALVWVPPGPAPLTDLEGAPSVRLDFEGKRWRIRAGDSRGVFLQEYALNQDRPVLFVPLSGRNLEFGKRVQVTDDRGVSVNTPPPALRAGDLCACGRDVLDLATGERTRLAIEPRWSLVALGSEHAADLGNLVRLSDGKMTPLPADGSAVFRAFAFRGRLAFGLRMELGRTGIVAVDVRDGRHAALLSVPHEQDSGWGLYARGGTAAECWPCRLFTTASGIYLHDGERWRVQPWIEALPD